MRIGILTLHSGANYGGTLQCYALYNILKKNGHSVKVIDYVPTRIAPLYKRILFRLSSRSVKLLLSEMFGKNKPQQKKRVTQKLVDIFNDFRKANIALTKRVDELSISTLNQDFDLIVVGSDQVWSSFVRDKLTYFCDWRPKFGGRLISYAACSTNDNYPIFRKRKLQKLLNNFNAISVRDNKSKSIISHLVPSKPIQVVLDPTQIYDFAEADTSRHIIEGPYIFVYVLGKELSAGNKKILDSLKRSPGIKDIKVVAVTVYDEKIGYADVTLNSAGPLEWVSLIKHASMVFTDSFHASVFSIKFKTPCLAYYSERDRASRLVNLFNENNMAKFLINDETADSIPELDFSQEYSGRNPEYSNAKVRESMEFLNNNIR